LGSFVAFASPLVRMNGRWTTLPEASWSGTIAPVAGSGSIAGIIRRSTIRWVTRCVPPGGQKLATWPIRSWLGSSMACRTTASPASTNGDIEPDVTISRRWPCSPNQAGTAIDAAKVSTPAPISSHAELRTAMRPAPRPLMARTAPRRWTARSLAPDATRRALTHPAASPSQ